MSIIENFKYAIFNIISSKVRTLLTTLGIIIGITSVIVITSIGNGFENQMSSTFDDINSDTVTIKTSYGETIRDKDKFVLDDLDRIRTLSNIEFASPSYELNVSVELKNPNETKNGTLMGSNSDTKGIDKVTMLYGRFLDERDGESKSKVCIIDNTIAREIFGREDVIGETINAITVDGKERNIQLQVIGVYEGGSSSLSTASIYLPVQTLMEFVGNTDQTFQSISVKFLDSTLFDSTKREILKVLVANHNNEEEKYTVSGNFSILDTIQSTMKMFTIFISFVAGISLLVGGIGVMNIMLVTVTERTREIGIRKSLGATNGNIEVQFLIEAMTISLMGGIVGIILGYIGSIIVTLVLRVIGNTITPQVSIPVVLGSAVISCLIGIIFGVYPAGKAAKLDPIEALRYE